MGGRGKHPSSARLQALITAFLASGGLSPGREAEEARTLWTAALNEAPRMSVPLDEVWLSELLARRFARRPQAEPGTRPSVEAVGAGERRQDWGEAPDRGRLRRSRPGADHPAWVGPGRKLSTDMGRLAGRCRS